jgi:hypothetical protein
VSGERRSAQVGTLHGDPGRALGELQTARQVAPQLVGTHPAVRETVRALVVADRRVSGELGGFAQWVGVRPG